MNDQDIKRLFVWICDPDHPHYPERGHLTGNTINVLGTPMTEVKLEHCRHGTDGCFVRKGQIEVQRHQP